MKNLINVLVKSQRKDGSFLKREFGNNILFSSLILIELEKVADKKIVKVKNKLSAWLFKDKLLDNDLATTFLKLIALFKSRPALVNGQLLGDVLNILIACESQEGGPYYFHPDNKNKIIDLGVNVVIAYFLQLNKVTLPRLNNLIEEAINKKDFSSKILNPYLVIYFISKFYQGPKKQALEEYALHRLKKLTGINQLLILSALSSLGSKVARPEEIRSESPLKASLLLNLSSPKIESPETDNLKEALMIKKILNEAKTRFAYLEPDLKKIALSEIKRTLKNNKDKQMSLIAYYFKMALGDKGRIINDDLLAKIGLANIFFWTAFIIYDDFWDEDESAIPSILPSANLYARHYVDFYSQILPEHPEFKIFFHKLMDRLDAANTWETKHCRTKVAGSDFIIPEKLPNYRKYENKFRPASGQILGPLVICLKLRLKLNSADISYLINYFKNYLIAMQINDDAHDWLEDMTRGHLSTVVVMIIEDWQKKYPRRKKINLISDIEKLQKIFWFQIIKRAGQTVLLHTKESRRALEKISYLEDKQPLAKFINIAENIAQEALDKQKQSLAILEKIKL